MSEALFVFHKDTSASCKVLSTFARLAEKLVVHGFNSTLLVADSSSEIGQLTSDAKAFAKVICVAVKQPIGHGADYLYRLVNHFQPAVGATLIIGVSNLSSRNWGPHIAAANSAEFMGGCDELVISDGRVLAVGPVMGGMVRKTTDITGRPAVLLYSGEEGVVAREPFAVTPVGIELAEGAVRFISSDPLPDTGGIPLAGASIVVAGGLGVGSAENWKLIEQFAQRIGAAVGASRAAVEMGWAPSTRQVGFSGQNVKPELYIAVGISGAVHHLAGIGGARRIVAINTDAEANIFKVADVAIVGDFKDVLSTAINKLN
jgi:electron transfer flavoprotein alpha subunit